MQTTMNISAHGGFSAQKTPDARAKIIAAIVHVSRFNQFYLLMLSRMQKKESAGVPTTGVGINQSGLTLIYNPKFVASIKTEVLSLCLAHECEHVFRAVFERRGGRDQKLFNISQDCLINESIPGFPPHIVIGSKKHRLYFVKTFAHLGVTKNMATEEVYDILRRNAIKSGTVLCGGLICGDVDQKSAEIIKQELKACAMSHKEACGSVPGTLEKVLNKLNRPALVWKKILRNFVASSITTDTDKSYKRPAKRCL